MQHLSRNALAKGTVLICNLKPNLEKWGNPGNPRKTQKAHFNRKKVCACWMFESWLGLCRIDLSCPFCVAGVAPSTYIRFKKKLKSFSRGEIDKSHVDKRILGGKGLQYEDSTSITFCPVSALRDRCCIDTKVFMWIHSAECECNTWAGTHWPKERRWFGICGQIWRAMGQPRQPKKNTKVTLRQEESLRLLKVWVMT